MLRNAGEEGVVMGLALAVALAGSLVLTPLARRIAWKIDAVSRPDGNRKRQRRPTALLGGLAVYASFIGALLATGFAGGQRAGLPLYVAVATSAGMLCLLGLIDDLYELRARTKLIGQIAATMPVVVAGFSADSLRLFGADIALHGLSAPWTIIWLVLAINAVNLIDGMDGLASTIGIVGGAAIAAIALWQGSPLLALPALALVGVLMGFVIHNLPPARIYLGDCGSMPIGLILALLGQEVSRTATGSVNVSILVLLLFVPLLDTGLAVVRRTLRGRSFMTPDYSHMHHQMLSQGLNVWTVLVVMGGLATTSGAMACCGAASGSVAWASAAVFALTALLAWRRLVAGEEQQLLRERITAWAARRPRAVAKQAIRVHPLTLFVAGEQSTESRAVPLAKVVAEQESLTGRQAA